MKGVGPLTMSASRRAAASGSPTHPRGERYLRYRPGWTVNEIPSTLDILGGVESGICG